MAFDHLLNSQAVWLSLGGVVTFFCNSVEVLHNLSC